MWVVNLIEHEDVIKKILPRRTSPQAFGLVGGEVDAVTASQRAALDSGFIFNTWNSLDDCNRRLQREQRKALQKQVDDLLG